MESFAPNPPCFAKFYATYLAAHRHPLNRLLHLCAKVLILTMPALAVLLRSPWPLLALPLVAVAPCWLGHFLFERNRPTSWSQPSESLLGWLRLRRARRAPERRAQARPYYSFLADWVMCASMFGVHFVASETAEPPSDRT